MIMNIIDKLIKEIKSAHWLWWVGLICIIFLI